MSQKFESTTIKSKIKTLSKDLVIRIAAGEIVTSFSSVVRELVENAIDSGAKTISITFNVGDLGIDVEDDGCGILPGDLHFATQRHATSKIVTFDDIFTSPFCGFRGEALAAISAVSEFSLITSTTEDGLGTQVWYKEGRLSQQEPVARERGTTAQVSKLFFNVPVREKFLKSTQSEKIKIKKHIMTYILAHPDISFRYFVVDGDKKTSELNVPGFFTLRERILHLFTKRGLAKGLLELKSTPSQDSPFFFTGYMTNYRFYFPNNKNQYLFYRGRAVQNDAFYQAVRQAYKHFLPKQYHSMVFIQLHTTDPYLIDVNAHPAKKQVRFKADTTFYKEIYKMINTTLREHMRFSANAMRHEGTFEQTQNEIQRNVQPQQPPENNGENKKKQFHFTSSEKELLGKLEVARASGNFNEIKRDEMDKIEEIFVSQLAVDDDFVGTEQSPENQTSPGNEELQGNRTSQENEQSLGNRTSQKMEEPQENRISQGNKPNVAPNQAEFFIKNKDHQQVCVFGQVAFLYIVFLLGNDLYLMDQHAAHERINYDFLLENNATKKPVRESLLVPLIFEFVPIDCEMLLEKECRSMLQHLGFVIERYGAQQISVEEVPAFLHDKQRESVAKEALRTCMQNVKENPVDFFREIVARWACRMSVMAGDVMTHDEMKALVEKVIAKNYQIHCPHGRPFVKKITLDELNSFFNRGRHISPQMK